MSGITLAEAEEKLNAYIDAGDEVGWAKVSQILLDVSTQELWREGQYHSFSAWVRGYARKKGCSESLLWKYAKAGRAYEHAREVDPELPPIERAGLSSQTVSTVEKIHGSDVKAQAEALSRVISGTLRPKDVEEQWKAVRKISGTRKSRHDEAGKTTSDESAAAMTRTLTAALARDAASWIWGAETPEEAEERKRAEAPRQYLTRDAVCVRTLTEFPVRVDTAQRARRIDFTAVCIENQTTADWMDVVLRGVEVKVSEEDLTHDEKMGDYGLFMDYMYIAVPETLVELASDAVPADWGLLAYDLNADKITVVREPVRLDAPRREDALMTACVKLVTTRNQ